MTAGLGGRSADSSSLAAAPGTLETLRRSHPDLLMTIEPASLGAWASKDHPFQLVKDGLIEETLDRALDAQRFVGANVALHN